jgi:hypothetical protein
MALVLVEREKRLQWSMDEAIRWKDQPVPDDRVAEYLCGCVRDGTRDLGVWLAKERLRGKKVAFCAAAIGFADSQVSVNAPPWRAGAKELKRDAILGIRGVWVPAIDTHMLGYRPPPGALAIYYRGDPNGWKGHVEQVVEAGDDGFRALGANEGGGKWYLDQKMVPYEHERLQGFVVEADDTPPILLPRDLPPCPVDFMEDDEDLEDIVRFHNRQLTVDWEEVRRARDALVREP